jgi:hypothetical protein
MLKSLVLSVKLLIQLPEKCKTGIKSLFAICGHLQNMLENLKMASLQSRHETGSGGKNLKFHFCCLLMHVTGIASHRGRSPSARPRGMSLCKNFF